MVDCPTRGRGGVTCRPRARVYICKCVYANTDLAVLRTWAARDFLLFCYIAIRGRSIIGNIHSDATRQETPKRGGVAKTKKADSKTGDGRP